MERNIRPSEKLLLFGYTLILLFMIVQDLIPLGNLNDIKAVASVHSTNEIIVITLIGVVQILLLIGGILFFIGKKYPLWIRIWLIIHPAFIFIGALFSWWIPYPAWPADHPARTRFPDRAKWSCHRRRSSDPRIPDRDVDRQYLPDRDRTSKATWVC